MTEIRKIPRDLRKRALKAIRWGRDLEAVAEANRMADEINAQSFYKKIEDRAAVSPYQLL